MTITSSQHSILRVAVFCVTDPLSGGASNYEKSVVELLGKDRSVLVEWHIFLPKRHSAVTPSPEFANRIHTYRTSQVSYMFTWMRYSLAGYALLKRIGLRYGRIERKLNKIGIQLAYFLSPNPIAIDLVDIPTMNTVWDLGHRDLPEFVEITGDRHFEERELFFNAVLPKSVHTFVDTADTADKISKIYGVIPSRISVTGLLVATPVNQMGNMPTRKQESKVDKYFLYPAQFWPHKAHILLLEALSVAKSSYPEMKIVLTGSDKGNLHYVNSRIAALQLQKNVDIRGFVSDEVLADLMVNAQALVFPSRLGPSNMPPLEALRLGTPIVISDVHRDTALISPISTVVQSIKIRDWADALEEAWTKDVSSLSPVEMPEATLLDNIHSVLEKFAISRNQWRNK